MQAIERVRCAIDRKRKTGLSQSPVMVLTTTSMCEANLTIEDKHEMFC